MSVNKFEELEAAASHHSFWLVSVKKERPLISSCKSKGTDEWRAWSIRENGN